MVTAPVLTHRIPLDLPQPVPRTVATPVEIDLRIDAAGGLSWNGAPTSVAALPAQLATIARDDAHPPLLRIDANADADYGVVAKILAMARTAGIDRIGFVRQQ
jgi:biopolymer transport protein ExbD